MLSYYATQPQSYYRTGIPNPDFPGVARFLRQLALPSALHVHFNGAGGNIGAGKYNDGSPENRRILAERLADGMRRAWEATRREPLTPEMIGWRVERVVLPQAKDQFHERGDEREAQMFRDSIRDSQSSSFPVLSAASRAGPVATGISLAMRKTNEHHGAS